VPTNGTIVLLFVVATLVALAAKQLRIPYTVALVVAGLALGLTGALNPPALTKELLFTLFLPGLLFEAAFHLDAEELWLNRLPIFSLALPGVVMATLVTATALVLIFGAIGIGSGITWSAAFVFATLIAATDPIAVVAIVRHLGAPLRLGVLIEGESLLNDGTAAVALSVTVAYVLGTAPTMGAVAADFIYAIGVGAIVGAVIGLAGARILAWLDDAMLMITVTVSAAYGAFILGESIHASGVIATVTAGLLCGTRASQVRLKPSHLGAVKTFWEYVGFALNSLVFLLIGFQARVPTLLRDWRPILIAYLVVTVGRALVTYLLAAVLPARNHLPWRWTAVLSWSGLRGALALVLALSLPAAIPQRELVITITVGVVVLSIIVQGLTVSPLLGWLGLRTAHTLAS
jgi:monovalent cation:H+ antiporter, CPA1 family